MGFFIFFSSSIFAMCARSPKTRTQRGHHFYGMSTTAWFFLSKAIGIFTPFVLMGFYVLIALILIPYAITPSKRTEKKVMRSTEFTFADATVAFKTKHHIDWAPATLFPPSRKITYIQQTHIHSVHGYERVSDCYMQIISNAFNLILIRTQNRKRVVME